MNHLKAFEPPTLETMAAHYYMRAYHHARCVCQYLRFDDRERASQYLGRAKTEVSVLYDLGDVRAYQANKSVERAARVFEEYEGSL